MARRLLPATDAPPSSAAWDESLAGFRRERDALKLVANDAALDLFAKNPARLGADLLPRVAAHR